MSTRTVCAPRLLAAMSDPAAPADPGRPTRSPRPARGAGRACGVAILAAVALSTGCETTGAGSDMDAALAAWSVGDDREAARLAGAAADGAVAPRDRAEARYLEGLALLRSGRPLEAERTLAEATADPEVGPRADAARGLALVAAGREREGAELLDAVADRLDPAEGSRARRTADAVWRRLGDPRGDRDADAGTAPLATAERGFGVQVGAYRSRPTAERTARDLGPRLAGAGLADPSISPRTGPAGDVLWAVRVGPFPTRRAAERFAVDRGEPGWRVVVLGR